MNFISLTRSYKRGNYLPLLLTAIVPAVLLAAFSRPLGLVRFFHGMFGGAIDVGSATYMQIFQYFSLINLTYPLLWLITFIAAVFFLGITYALIERKMKYGTLKGVGLRSTLKTSFFVVVPVAGILLILLNLVGFVTAGIVFWLFALFNGALAAKIISMVVVVALYLVVVVYLVLLVCWVPCMTADGLNILDAVGLSARMAAKRQKELFWTLLIGLIVLHGVSFAFFTLGETAFRACLLVFAISSGINIPAYINAVYFELAEVPRRDLKSGRRRQ
jgi:hypothetical protein